MNHNVNYHPYTPVSPNQYDQQYPYQPSPYHQNPYQQAPPIGYNQYQSDPYQNQYQSTPLQHAGSFHSSPSNYQTGLQHTGSFHSTYTQPTEYAQPGLQHTGSFHSYNQPTEYSSIPNHQSGLQHTGSFHQTNPAVTLPGQGRSITVHSNRHVGHFFKIIGSSDAQDWKTYELYLENLPVPNDYRGIRVFEDLPDQGWNTSYKAAQRIFGHGFDSTLVSNYLSKAHSVLYNQYEPQDTTRFPLNRGEDFLQLLNYGQRNGRHLIYTYALLNGVMRFSETDATFHSTDLNSKHALHANISPIVKYAGEFHIANVNGRYSLLIDNNSGTYAPKEENLGKLKNIFVANFPDLQVFALDRKDPMLVESKKRLNLHGG